MISVLRCIYCQCQTWCIFNLSILLRFSFSQNFLNYGDLIKYSITTLREADPVNWCKAILLSLQQLYVLSLDDQGFYESSDWADAKVWLHLLHIYASIVLLFVCVGSCSPLCANLRIWLFQVPPSFNQYSQRRYQVCSPFKRRRAWKWNSTPSPFFSGHFVGVQHSTISSRQSRYWRIQRNVSERYWPSSFNMLPTLLSVT